MNKIKVFHEAPICVMEQVSKHTDGEYCLPHLMDQKENYKNYFLKAKEKGRYILLDNSLHELGKPYTEERLHYWLQTLQPNEFFIPDYWEDKTQSIVSARKWIQYQNQYPNITFIAVVQAKNPTEAAECYQTYKDLGYKKIAFSYGAEWYKSLCYHPNEFLSKALGRIKAISDLIMLGIISKNDNIHLLGTAYPGEFAWYQYIPCIKSIDTSNPVISAYEGVRYSYNGLYNKPKTKIDEIIDESEITFDKQLLEYNLEMFRKINNL